MKAFSYAWLVYVVPLSLLIPLITALLKSISLRRPLWILVGYLVVSGSINMVAILNSGKNNLPYLHLYTCVEGTLLLLFYQTVQPVPWMRQLNTVLIFAFPLLCIINGLFLQSIYQFNSYVRPIEAILLIGNSAYYSWYDTAKRETGSWTANPFNWINAGFLLYFSGSLFQFIFSNVVSATAGYTIKLLILDIHGTLVLCMYILMAIGFYKCNK
ncbi:hypothetical protein A3860_32800 [Niastella vici]|uniref:Uncharacterized protein n=1 Tax=Niastella vici TaxID=1703345 RepID=A0A1V9FQE8_9BACT|nr:hypothetical protein [Niastella vici]OQP60595.1 hypothetical protein A3860_32800 [Niastella vici]